MWGFITTLWDIKTRRSNNKIMYHCRECDNKATNRSSPSVHQQGIHECSECIFQPTPKMVFSFRTRKLWIKNNSISSPSTWVENIGVDFVDIKQLEVKPWRGTLGRCIIRILFFTCFICDGFYIDILKLRYHRINVGLSRNMTLRVSKILLMLL